MKNKIKKMPMIVLVIAIVLVVFTYLNSNNSYEEKIINKPNKVTKGIALNLEQTEGAGDYKLVTQSNWPTDGYIFNKERSGCENGGELSWDDTNKTVVFSGNVSDKCYVYFDIWVPSVLSDVCTNGDNLASCVKTFGDQGSDISNIYIHTSTLANGAGDNSYRYAGPSDQVNNFICFGSTTSPCPTNNLYRIVGVFGENYHGVSGKQLVKLIKYDYMTTDELGTDGDYYGAYTYDASTYKGNNYANIASYYWNYKADSINYPNGSNTWSTSLLNKTNLNTNFINYLGTEWSNKIATTTWKVGGNTSANIRNVVPATAYQNEIVNSTPGSTSTTGETEYEAKIGLMYVSDYGFAASPSAWNLTMYNYNDELATNNNWMYMGLYEWPISRYANLSNIAFGVSIDGRVNFFNVNERFVGRATFNLESSVTYKSGTGTMSNPITINL